MNNYYVVEPANYENWRDLKIILEQFGPYHGRYVVAYPPSWRDLIIREMVEWRDVERKRAIEIIKKLNDRRGLIRYFEQKYDTKKTWRENVAGVREKIRPIPFSGAVVCEGPSSELFTAAEDFSLSPTADERIEARPDEYSRVCEALLKFSEFVILIDPYLDISNEKYAPVIESLLKKTAGGCCKEFKIFARAKEVSGSFKEIRFNAHRLLKNSKGAVNKITYKLCDDKGSVAPMHARYLLSSHGGIRLDQGFQRLRRKVDVSVVGEATRNSLWEEFSNDGAPFPIAEVIEVAL